MNSGYGTLNQAAASPYPHAQPPMGRVSGQEPGGPSSYVGAHRSRDSQGLNPADAQPQPGYRPRHRRLP
jgi:hypothetical protein